MRTRAHACADGGWTPELAPDGSLVLERIGPFCRQTSTRILGMRTAPFPAFLIYYRVPHGFNQDPSTDHRIVILAGPPGGGEEEQARAADTKAASPSALAALAGFDPFGE